jgi:hypothetical protein
MDEGTLNQFLTIARVLRRKIYSIQMPQAVILDLDSTLLDAYGRQEGRAFNFHYQSNGYHPLFIPRFTINQSTVHTSSYSNCDFPAPYLHPLFSSCEYVDW